MLWSSTRPFEPSPRPLCSTYTCSKQWETVQQKHSSGTDNNNDNDCVTDNGNDYDNDSHDDGGDDNDNDSGNDNDTEVRA